jgi:hypothetical protein
VWLTGAAWVAFHYFVRVTDAYGFSNEHPLQHWWLVAHASLSLGALWLFGVLWPGHVLPNWRARLSRVTGGLLFGLVVWFAVSGLALYYIGADRLRGWTSTAHWVSGLLALVPFLIHRRRGLRIAEAAPP